MGIEVAKEIGAVTREIGCGERNGESTRIQVSTRTYDIGQVSLWDALTYIDRIPRWFLPISGDLRPGGSYQLEGNASGEITECQPLEHFALTWVIQDQISWVDVRLSVLAPGGTELRLEHIAHIPPELWAEYGPGATGIGWDLTLLGLEQHFLTGDKIKPETAAVWMGSAEGQEFVRRSSHAWCEASIEAGTDRDLALSSAERAAAFYLGTGENGEEV